MQRRKLTAWLGAVAFGFGALIPLDVGAASVATPTLVTLLGLRTLAAENNTPDRKKGSERTWVKHKVVPRERLEDIAERYGVSRNEILRWNKKKLGDKGWIFAGQTLSIHARHVPPPREKTTYVVQFGDTWGKIAAQFNVRESDLRYWNKKVPRRFKAGTSLVVYTNPLSSAVPEEEGDVDGPAPLPEFKVRPGGLSVGKPNHGRLINGVQLPPSDDYTIRDPDKAWGSSHAVLNIQRAMAQFRRDSGYDGEVTIGAISLRNGGRFRPHRSHQSGRDADIGLPRKPGAPRRSSSPDDIDWRAAWFLVKSFADTGEVEYIFLDWNRQRRLYRAAEAAGATREELDRLIQYPRPRKTHHGLVRHAEGHVVHIHVRIKCAPHSTRCESY